MLNFVEHLTSDNQIGLYCYNIAPYNTGTFYSVINSFEFTFDLNLTIC